jgi:hypothetical protein
MMKYLTAAIVVASVAWPVAACSSSTRHPAALTQEPLIMRLSKDEFRIAFGIAAERCAPGGCTGTIRYRVDWRTEDGSVTSELKRVSFIVPPHYSRAMTVDRQYFDTAEGAHTTDVVKVTVDRIDCVGGPYAASQAPQAAARVARADAQR